MSALYVRQCRQFWSLPAVRQRGDVVLRCFHQRSVKPPLCVGLIEHNNTYRFMSQESTKNDSSRPDTIKNDLNSKEPQGHGTDRQKKTSRQRLSIVFAKYGVTAVVFHTTISLTSLGLCYAAVSSGLDIPGFLMKIGASESLSTSIAAKGASTFVIAYACHKMFMPLRIFLTVTCTPLIVYRLQRLGILKAR